ncbi:phospholipase [Streptomyces sp. SCA3-4]|uniref:phospholipase n=1 Tax=Streptomyces sichuanensis TaxID=2871810 RepID=UPI001CE39198|nr:phospholipase [Streptomyces sichuanensis]MCA6091163.1 phospholipase [Streptomyces sichuanensis]
MHRFTTPLAAAALTVTAVVTLASPAQAAVPADKAQVLAHWTQTSASSSNAWNAARQNQGAWASYRFDWSTDYCSKSPDNPFGFPFRNSCARHDFGYRNYKVTGTLEANKARLDNALHEDLKRVCNTYSGAKHTACNATAWTYYQAVSALGT